jgi:hypothetical protein
LREYQGLEEERGVPEGPKENPALRDLLLPAVCFTATQALKAAGAAEASKQGVAQGQTAAAAAAAAAAAGGGSASSSGSRDGTDAVSLLPWVVIIGRCFLHWGVELMELVQEGFPPAAAAAAGAAGSTASTVAAEAAAAARCRCAALYGTIQEQAMSAYCTAQEVLLECDSIAHSCSKQGIPVRHMGCS